jgi:molybdopterin/thiamine biosynthesis adenylyltransferase
MARAIVVGAGNIGSHMLPHLARVPQITDVLIIDRDAYTAANAKCQSIDRADIGQLKAAVQARYLHRIAPALQVTWLHSALERVPLGLMRADVILACVDSRRARLRINQTACRLGVPWIDAGLHADDGLARVRAFRPGPDALCLECRYSDSDYAAVEQDYPCAPAALAPTGGTSHLGALAAAMQVHACEAILGGRSDLWQSQSEWLINAQQRTQFLTSYRRSHDCRMPDHASWDITPLEAPPSEMTLRAAFRLAEARADEPAPEFSVANSQLVIEPECPRCTGKERTVRVWDAHPGSPAACAGCGITAQPGAFSLFDSVCVDDIPQAALGSTLADLGLRPHDVFTLSHRSGEQHFELGDRE